MVGMYDTESSWEILARLGAGGAIDGGVEGSTVSGELEAEERYWVVG